MGILDLPFEEQERVRWVLGWIERMGEKYGGTVYDKNGKRWDWGQALCRECYGEGWNDNPELPDTPTQDDIEKAKQWENGNMPEWVDTE